MNIAQWQQIVFGEYFPALHEDNPEVQNGENNIVLQYLKRQDEDGTGFDPDVNPNVDIAFSTAAFRFGHSTARDRFEESGPDSSLIGRKYLGETFFSTREVTNPSGFGTSGFLLVR